MRMLDQLQKEVPVRMAGDHQWWKRISGDTPSRGPWKIECTAPRREPLHDAHMGLILQGVKAGQCPKKKDKSQGQYGVLASYTRAIMDITGGLP
jgi:hypothetical protein